MTNSGIGEFYIISRAAMRIAKPLLLVTTPIGLVIGLYEGWRLAGGLVFLMAAMIALVGAAMLGVVLTVRREKREQEASSRTPPPAAAPPDRTPGQN